MMERTQKGKEVRDWFIQKEKEYRQSSQNSINVELQKRVLKQQKAQLKQKIKVVDSEIDALNNMPVQCPKCQRICKNQKALNAHKCFPKQRQLFG